MPAEPPDWVANAIFYQIFPDRFARRDDTNSGMSFESWDAPPTPLGFKGGDLYGVADRLDYLVDLGVTALYLNPVFSSAANHRYHTYDFLQVDPLLGGTDALRFLLDEAHDRNVRVVLDGVFNHASRGFWQFHHVLENGQASPFCDWFHFDPERLQGQKPFQPYPDSEAADALKHGQGSLEAIGYAAWWNLPALPKFNTKTPAVREFLFNVAEHWVRFGIDGWRLDVPNEINDNSFWREFRSRVRAINREAYIVGEIWGEASRWLNGDMWDAVMNYQITSACLGFFGGSKLDVKESRRPSSFQHVRSTTGTQFSEELERLESLYPRRITRSQLNLLDSHDMPRFLTCVQNHVPSLRLAWLLICTLPGAPCIFYGDEIGMQGRHDPDCRRGFPWQPSSWNHELQNWYRTCIELRRDHAALRHGTRRTLYATERQFVSLHESADDDVIVAYNTADNEITLPLQATTASNRTWMCVIGEEPSAQPSNTLEIRLPPWSAVVLTSPAN
jgi:cyclomaltodextrinase / maltogenic alpha-amylase / neopullulanase